jgi:hypothetical protein
MIGSCIFFTYSKIIFEDLFYAFKQSCYIYCFNLKIQFCKCEAFPLESSRKNGCVFIP